MKVLFVLFLYTFSKIQKNTLLIKEDEKEGEFYCLERIQDSCLKCALSYPDQEQFCKKPQVTIDGCISYDSETTCRQCQYRRQLSLDKKTCKKIEMKNCLFQTDEYCIGCENQFLPLKGKCEGNPLSKIKNCEVFTVFRNQEQCMLCQRGFTLRTQFNQNDCVFFEKLSGCEQADDNNRCKLCNYNYYMNDRKKCEKTDKYDVEEIAQGSLLKVFSILFLAVFIQFI